MTVGRDFIAEMYKKGYPPEYFVYLTSRFFEKSVRDVYRKVAIKFLDYVLPVVREMNLPAKGAEHVLMDALIDLYNSTAGIKRSGKNAVKYLLGFHKIFTYFEGEEFVRWPGMVAEKYDEFP